MSLLGSGPLDSWRTHVRNAPRRGPVVGVTAVASALLVGTGTAHAVVSPPPVAVARPGVPGPPAARAAAPASWTSKVTLVPGKLPRVYRLALREQYQATSYYCVPA